MATTDETIRLAGDLRIWIDDQVDEATRDIVEAWAEVWQNLSLDWGLAYQPIINAHAAGTKVSRSQILKAERTTKALVATRRAIQELTEYAGVRIMQPVDVIVRRSAETQLALIASQLPEGDIASDVRASLQRVDQLQLTTIVDRTRNSVTSLVNALPSFARQAINAELIRGIALGINPRAVARDMVSASQFVSRMNVAFLLPLNRANIIARTELLDAHRGAARLGQAANADVLQGWQWMAKLDRRTCPSCWSMHGTTHSLIEPGPHDHQQGRCARLPVTKSWKELGFDGIDEPEPLMRNAQAEFWRLPESEQALVMGKERLAQLKRGDLAWDDLSMVTSTPGWRKSYVVRPLAS